MVNFGNPSTNSVPHQLRYNRHEASQKPQPPSEYPTIGNFFRRDFPTTSISTNKHTNRSISDENQSTKDNSDSGGRETLETPNIFMFPSVFEFYYYFDLELFFILERFILQVKVEVALFNLESVFC